MRANACITSTRHLFLGIINYASEVFKKRLMYNG